MNAAFANVPLSVQPHVQHHQQQQHLQQHTHISDSAVAVSRLVAKLRQLVLNERDPLVSYELEARFGTVNAHAHYSGQPSHQHYPGGTLRFQSGVPHMVMEKIMRDLASYDHWFNVDEFHEMQDFVYPVHNIGNVRTTVQYDDKHTGELKRRHIHKERLDSVMLRLEHADGGHVDPSVRPYLLDVRIDLNREQEIRDDDPRLPQLQNTTHMRIKQRRSYCYASAGALRPTWQFDVTFSWSGTNKTEAERQQKMHPPVCEFECELVNPRYVLLETGKDDMYVASSLLLKMADFIPISSPQYRWQPVHRNP